MSEGLGGGKEKVGGVVSPECLRPILDLGLNCRRNEPRLGGSLPWRGRSHRAGPSRQGGSVGAEAAPRSSVTAKRRESKT